MKPSETIDKKIKESGIAQQAILDPMFWQFMKSIMECLDGERDRVNGILHGIVTTVYESRGDFSEKRLKEIIALIDETLAEPSEK